MFKSWLVQWKLAKWRHLLGWRWGWSLLTLALAQGSLSSTQASCPECVGKAQGQELEEKEVSGGSRALRAWAGRPAETDPHSGLCPWHRGAWVAWAGEAGAAGLGWFQVCPWGCGGVRCRHLWGEKEQTMSHRLAGFHSAQLPTPGSRIPAQVWGDGSREQELCTPWQRFGDPLLLGPQVPLTEHVLQHPGALLRFSSWDWWPVRFSLSVASVYFQGVSEQLAGICVCRERGAQAACFHSEVCTFERTGSWQPGSSPLRPVCNSVFKFQLWATNCSPWLLRH